MDMAQSLSDLGCTPDLLTAEQYQHLDEQGYLILPGIIDDVWLKQLQECMESLLEREGPSAGLEVHQEAGARRLSDLVNKSPFLMRCIPTP